MALPTRRPVPRAMVASATRLDRKESAYTKRLLQPWQNRALAYYDQIGELRYAASFYARQISRCRFYPGTLQDDGSVEAIESGAAVELLNRVQDLGGGRAKLLYDYGKLMFITGEGVLFQSDGPPERWRFLWKEEVKIRDDGVAVRLDIANEETSEVGVAYRMWTPHPRHSSLADSPMRPVTDIAEELIILTASVRGTAVSRLTNGILALATELSPPPDDPGADEDPEENIFLARFVEHLQNQIENPGSAESKVPFVLEGGFDYIKEGVKWIATHDPQTDYMERDLRVEAIKRLALSMDMPPEALLGMTDANHWTAKQVQHDMWRAHGAPVADRFGEDLAAAYLRPALEQEGESWENVVVAYDDSQVVISPDRSEDADNAMDRGAISDEGYRQLKGIPEDMAPSKDEKDIYLAIKLRDPVIAGLEPTPTRGPVPTPNANGNAADGPPPPVAGRSVSRPEARTASLAGSALMALRQCRAKAGARLRSDIRPPEHPLHCAECAEKINGLPQSIVASVLGAEQLAELGRKDPLALVKGGTDEFRGLLREQGFDPTEAESLCQRLELYAAKTLFEAEQPELPPGFMAQIEQGLELSHAA